MSDLGHKRTFRLFRPMPLYPQKRTSELSREMSPLSQELTFHLFSGHLPIRGYPSCNLSPDNVDVTAQVIHLV